MAEVAILTDTLQQSPVFRFGVPGDSTNLKANESLVRGKQLQNISQQNETQENNIVKQTKKSN